MDLAFIALNQILVMFIIILVGVFCSKIKMISNETNKTLSNIVLMLINPLVIFNSYQIDFDNELFKGLMFSFVLAFFSLVFAIILSNILIKKTDKSDYIVERFSAIYSNCGFMGIPLINGLFGKEGVFYLTAYLTVFNLLVWTHGIIMMTEKKDFSSFLKAIKNPSVIAIFLGFLSFVTGIKITGVLYTSAEQIASMNTPFAMLVAGVSIAQTDLKLIYKKIRIYWVCFIKLLIIPTVLVFIFKFINLSESILMTSLIASSCPSGAMGTLFAIKYKRNSLYASELFAMTTLFSAVTIPIIIFLTGLIW